MAGSGLRFAPARFGAAGGELRKVVPPRPPRPAPGRAGGAGGPGQAPGDAQVRRRRAGPISRSGSASLEAGPTLISAQSWGAAPADRTRSCLLVDVQSHAF